MRKTKRILCVEDHQDMCDLIKRILDPYEVVSVQSKADAIWKATEDQFDLYLLDYHLPDGTGLELCLLIRAFDPTTPIYFCSGTSSLTVSQVDKAGAQGFIKQGHGFVADLLVTVSGIFEQGE